MATATKTKATKTASKKGAAKAAKPSTKDKLLEVARAAGSEGVDIKTAAAQIGVSQDTARKAAKVLTDEGTVKMDGPGRLIAKGRVGRRSAEVVERDEKILAFISEAGAEGRTRKEIAEGCDTTERLVYESIWRLRASGKVAREGATRTARWVAA